jgi:hypothetical protein
MEIGSAAFNKTKSEIEALEKRIASATKTAEVAK